MCVCEPNHNCPRPPITLTAAPMDCGIVITSGGGGGQERMTEWLALISNQQHSQIPTYLPLRMNGRDACEWRCCHYGDDHQARPGRSVNRQHPRYCSYCTARVRSLVRSRVSSAQQLFKSSIGDRGDGQGNIHTHLSVDGGGALLPWSIVPMLGRFRHCSTDCLCSLGACRGARVTI